MKIKKAMAVLCALAVVFTSSGGLPFGGLRMFDTAISASARGGAYETLDLTQHYSDGLPESFTGEHFSVNVTSINGSFFAMEDLCWQFDGDYSEDEANALISALSGETITKLVVHRLNWSDNTLIVKANGNSVSYTQSPISEDVSDFTYENINASEVKLFANPDYYSSGYCYVSSIDVYYTGGSAPMVTVIGNIAYNLDDANHTAEAVAYNGSDESVEIPSSVYYNGWTYNVTSINSDGFQNSSFKNIVIGENVLSIPDNAFKGCTDLTAVTIGKGVTSIGANAFNSCDFLADVTFVRPSVEQTLAIGSNAFGTSAKLIYDGNGKYALYDGDDEAAYYLIENNSKTLTWKATVSPVDPTYTITIPAEVDLASTDPVNITAEYVTLGEGQKIIVTLDSASNTDSGSEFSAKTENGKSVVKYTINDGAIGVDESNNTVAEFASNGSKALTFAVTDKSGIKAAGKHTEILTFTVGLDGN